MGNAGSKGSDRHRKPARSRSQDKAAAMRDAVRKAIESLIEKKGPAKHHPCALLIVGWTGFLASHLHT